MTKDMKKEFWDRMEDIRSGMLGATDAPIVPMTHYADDDHPNTLWFITSKTTDLGRAAVAGADAQYLVSSKDEQLYARLDGRIRVSDNEAQLDDIWNAFAAAWFEGDKNDPDVQLLRMDLTQGEVWITGGSMQFLYEIAKANVTEDMPDVGMHGTIRF